MKHDKQYVSIGEASKLTGLGPQTIRKLVDKSTFVCYKTPSGQRRVSMQSVQDFCCNRPDGSEASSKQNFLYARVSTKKQVDDLSRQIENIRRPQFSGHRVVTDVGSGINFKRKGLSIILESCLQGNIGEVVVAHRDRLCRFGFDLIEQLVVKAGGKVVVLDSDDKDCEQELAEDLLAIVHVFSCKPMGKRSYRRGNDRRTNVESNKSEALSHGKSIASA